MISLYINYLLLRAGAETGGYGLIIAIFILIFYDAVIAVPIWKAIFIGLSRRDKDNDKTPPQSSPPKQMPTTIRCPNCGSPATVRGNSWECGWCGDFGNFR